MILEGLNEHLEALTFTPALPIVWPEKAIDLPADNKFLRAIDIPDETRNLALAGGAMEYSGIYQVDCCWPMGLGLRAVTEIAGAVTDHFAPLTVIVRENARIQIRGASRGPTIDDHPRIFVPVSIRYQAFV